MAALFTEFPLIAPHLDYTLVELFPGFLISLFFYLVGKKYANGEA